MALLLHKPAFLRVMKGVGQGTYCPRLLALDCRTDPDYTDRSPLQMSSVEIPVGQGGVKDVNRTTPHDVTLQLDGQHEQQQQ